MLSNTYTDCGSNYSPGTLPEGQNGPHKCKYDLYAEGVSDSLGIFLSICAEYVVDDWVIVCCSSS